MRRLLIAALAALAACGSIKDQPLTEENVKKLRESKDLTEKDRSLVASYMARTAFARLQKGDTTDMFFDDRVTIGQAIEAQRKYEHDDSVRNAATRRAADEARKRRQAQLAEARGMVSVTVTGKRQHPRSTQAMRFNDHAVLSLAIANTGTRPIAGIKGRLLVRDLFDDEIVSLQFKHDDPIAPGARATVERFYEINPYIDEQARLYATEFTKLKVTWEPQTLLFPDGTKLEIPDNAAENLADALMRLP